MADILITSGTVITMDGQRRVLDDCSEPGNADQHAGDDPDQDPSMAADGSPLGGFFFGRYGGSFGHCEKYYSII